MSISIIPYVSSAPRFDPCSRCCGSRRDARSAEPTLRRSNTSRSARCTAPASSTSPAPTPAPTPTRSWTNQFDIARAQHPQLHRHGDGRLAGRAVAADRHQLRHLEPLGRLRRPARVRNSPGSCGSPAISCSRRGFAAGLDQGRLTHPHQPHADRIRHGGAGAILERRPRPRPRGLHVRVVMHAGARSTIPSIFERSFHDTLNLTIGAPLACVPSAAIALAAHHDLGDRRRSAGEGGSAAGRPAPLWTGFYIGAHGGWGQGRSRLEDPSLRPFAAGSLVRRIDAVRSPALRSAPTGSSATSWSAANSTRPGRRSRAA